MGAATVTPILSSQHFTTALWSSSMRPLSCIILQAVIKRDPDETEQCADEMVRLIQAAPCVDESTLMQAYSAGCYASLTVTNTVSPGCFPIRLRMSLRIPMI